MRQSTLPGVVVAAVLACGLSGVASAQFFLDLTIDSMSPVTCTTAGLSANGSGTSSYNLPPPPDNEIATLLVNFDGSVSFFASLCTEASALFSDANAEILT